MSFPPEDWNIIHDDVFMAYQPSDTSRPLTAEVLLQMNRYLFLPPLKKNCKIRKLVLLFSS